MHPVVWMQLLRHPQVREYLFLHWDYIATTVVLQSWIELGPLWSARRGLQDVKQREWLIITLFSISSLDLHLTNINIYIIMNWVCSCFLNTRGSIENKIQF